MQDDFHGGAGPTSTRSSLTTRYLVGGALVVLILISVYYYFHSAHNTENVKACPTCDSRTVHSAFDDKKDAARLMEEIHRRNKTLIEHLRAKYEPSERPFDPDKRNAIDVIGSTEMYDDTENGDSKGDDANKRLRMPSSEYIQERINQLVENYDGNNIREISPNNPEGLTSYTEDKRRLILCLRSKSDMRLHGINLMMFVVLHELSHMMNEQWDHHLDFWRLFKFVLNNAVECGIYTPVDYSKHHVVYCGLDISYNPMFDARL